MTRKRDREMILKKLQSGYRLSGLDAFEIFRTLSLAQHIAALRQQGHDIETDIVIGNSGKRYAEYYIDQKKSKKRKKKTATKTATERRKNNG